MTIGHSTRPIKDFISLLKAHQIGRLVDVRTVPRSRHNPQFNRNELSRALHSARLHYRYMPGLGGFRHARQDSTNTGWHNASLRGFADYMQTPEFRTSLDDLIALAKAEKPWFWEQWTHSPRYYQYNLAFMSVRKAKLYYDKTKDKRRQPASAEQ